MFRAFKRLFIWLGLMAEKATETDAINQAVVERGLRDSKLKADQAHTARITRRNWRTSTRTSRIMRSS